MEGYFSSSNRLLQVITSINDVVSNNAMNKMNIILLISFLTRLKPEVKYD